MYVIKLEHKSNYILSYAVQREKYLIFSELAKKEKR